MAGNGEIKEDGGKGVKDIYGCAIHTNKKKTTRVHKINTRNWD